MNFQTALKSFPEGKIVELDGGSENLIVVEVESLDRNDEGTDTVIVLRPESGSEDDEFICPPEYLVRSYVNLCETVNDPNLDREEITIGSIVKFNYGSKEWEVVGLDSDGEVELWPTERYAGIAPVPIFCRLEHLGFESFSTI